jgi:predicted lysophospholipase L1 biosynthesis ABC-type transport system permease subunit
LLGKLIRKHKKTFAMAAAIAVILAGATVFSTWQAYVANRERAIATAVSDFLHRRQPVGRPRRRGHVSP